MVRAATGIQITWTEWFVGFLPVRAVLLLLLFLGALLLIGVPWLNALGY